MEDAEPAGQCWGLVQAQFTTPSTDQLREIYMQLDAQHSQVGIDDGRVLHDLDVTDERIKQARKVSRRMVFIEWE